MSGKDHKPISSSNLIRSFDYALKGLVYVIKTERNMRIHIFIAVLVLMVSLFLNLTRFEIMSLILAIALVLITEILNTASELIVNLVTEHHHPLAKIIKDLTAGAVLFSSICAVVIGYLVFINKETLDMLRGSMVMEKISSFPPHLTAVVVFIVIFVAVAIKAFTEKNPAVEGGMPSIHTAVASSLATLVYFFSSSEYLFILALILAFMVGQARVSSKVHSLWEVAAGGLLGIGLTVLIFQLIT